MLLDASALLALLNHEPGSDLVEEQIPGALISAVNLAEVVGKLADLGMAMDEVRVVIEVLGLEIVEFDAQMAFEAGRLRTATRGAGLSLGDRACLATASLRNEAVLTGDRSWLSLDLGVSVHCIRI